MLMLNSRGVSPPGGCPVAAGVLDRMNEADWTTAGVLHERYLGEVFHYVLRRVLRDPLAGLKEGQREALVLKYGERLSVAEIAVVMDRSPAAVYGLPERARAPLAPRGRGHFL